MIFVQLMRININEQRAQIGLNITRSNLVLNQPSPEIQISDQPTQLQINAEQPTFTVNTDAIRREIGLSTSRQFAQDFAHAGRQAAMQGIARRASEGDTMARLQVQGTDAFPIISRNAQMARLGPVDFNVGLMPTSSPVMTWHVNQIDINFTRHSLQVDAPATNLAQVSLSPQHAVNAYFEVPPQMNISAVPLYV